MDNGWFSFSRSNGMRLADAPIRRANHSARGRLTVSKGFVKPAWSAAGTSLQ